VLNNIFGLVCAKNRSVLVANFDSQPSLEEKILEKLVREVYGGDFAEFYRLNDLDIPEDSGNETDFRPPAWQPRCVLSITLSFCLEVL
jgi:hypothetical protein